MTKLSRASITAAAYGSIRQAIITGALAPATSIAIGQFSEQLGVSPASVQKAVILLESEGLVESLSGRVQVVTPNSQWFIATLARASGTSITAVELGVARATDDELAQFAEASARVVAVWEQADPDQFEAVRQSWQLLDLLAEFTQNRFIVQNQERASAALAFGRRHLGKPRNPVMVADALRELSSLVERRDGAGAADVIRDLYAFVAFPYLEELGLIAH